MRKRKSILLSFLITGIALYSATAQEKLDDTVVIVPAWKIQVVDPAGKPMRNVFVRQVWRDYDMEDTDHEADAYTDGKGFVSFPERRRPKASEDARITNRLENLKELDVHASFGVHAYILAWGKIKDCKRLEGGADYSPGKPLPTKIRTSISIVPGLKCRYDGIHHN